MKKIYSVTCVLFATGSLYAQNANLVLDGPGVRVVNDGANIQLVLDNANLLNNASAGSFVADSGTVVFSGNGTASVGGSSSTAFYNLSNNKPSTELVLGTDISTANVLSISNGNINLQSATLDMLTTGSVTGETYPNGSRMYCADGSPGRIKATRTLTTGSNNNIAGLGLDIAVTGAAPGSTVIYRGHDRQTSTAFAGAGTSIGRYYDITPSVTSGFTYTFLFRYHDMELGGMTESDFVFYRSPSHGSNTGDWEEWGAGNGSSSPGYPTAGLATHNSSANTVSLSGINTFSRWTVSNSVVTPLPIELLSFGVTCLDNRVQVDWKTASEINNASFTIYRSPDLQHWENVATLNGAGNSNQTLSYSITDERPLNGLAYYRLVQTDYDGTNEAFTPVSSSCQTQDAQSMAVFPNPADDRFTVAVTVTEAYPEAGLEISDLNGKRIATRNVSLVAGTNHIPFDRTGMNPGPYIIRLRAGQITLTPIKLIIQ